MPQLDPNREQNRVPLSVRSRDYLMISMPAQGERGEQRVFRQIAEHRFTPTSSRQRFYTYGSISALSAPFTLSGVDIISNFSEQGRMLTPDHPDPSRAVAAMKQRTMGQQNGSVARTDPERRGSAGLGLSIAEGGLRMEPPPPPRGGVK